MEIDPIAQKIIDACEEKFDANKADCHDFVTAVAQSFGIIIVGNADSIVDQLLGKEWTKLTDGIEAQKIADGGKFVIGGLKSTDTVPSKPNTTVTHGHVVIVVLGVADQGRFPRAYWGSIDGVWSKVPNNTVNYAWNKASRDKVQYAWRDI